MAQYVLLLNIYRRVQVKHAKETMSLTFKNSQFNYLTNPIYDQQCRKASQCGVQICALCAVHIWVLQTVSSTCCILWHSKHLPLLSFEFWMLFVPNYYSFSQNNLLSQLENYYIFVIGYLGQGGQFSLNVASILYSFCQLFKENFSYYIEYTVI